MASLLACSRKDERLRNSAPHAPAGPVNYAAAEPQRDQALYLERRDEREQLVRRHLEAQGIEDSRVLGAMRRVPRHLFVPESHRNDAYLDRPLPIGKGQTISQPYIVALMTQAARISKQDRCLDIGTGSGYQAAILAELCASTYSIEYVPELADFAKANLRGLSAAVHLRTGDGYRGWPEAAPFDVIIVAAAPEKVPQPLLDQLALGGRLVIPVGATDAVQRLELWLRRELGSAPKSFERRTLADVRFVPFVGEGAR